MLGFVGDSTAYGTPGYKYCLGGTEDMYTHSQHLHDYENSVFYRAKTARDMYNLVYKHGNINKGAPGVGDMAFFEGGPDGHSALGIGHGYVVSNDILDKGGKPTYQPILYTDLQKKWGGAGAYKGYTPPTGPYGGKETDLPADVIKESFSGYKYEDGGKLPKPVDGGPDAQVPNNPVVPKPPVSIDQQPVKPDTSSSSQDSSSGSGFVLPFGSLFGSLLSGIGQQTQAVAPMPTSAPMGGAVAGPNYTPSPTEESSSLDSSEDVHSDDDLAEKVKPGGS
jgi:hypothetical protein